MKQAGTVFEIRSRRSKKAEGCVFPIMPALSGRRLPIENQKSKIKNAFTLIELLIVIGIIALLAGLLLPAIVLVRQKVKIASARQEMKLLEAAINQYAAEYSQPPGISANGQDVTYGYAGSGGVASNSDVMTILMDLNFGINLNHVHNPKHETPFNARTARDSKSWGFSTDDNQLHDPWGNPYVITLDMDGDGWCRDALYSSPIVSGNSGPKGLNGLIDTTGTGNGPFLYHGPVMIWSLGPDGKADPNLKANLGENKDNILGWQ